MPKTPSAHWLCESVCRIDNLLTPKLCQRYIEIAEDVGFEAATVNTPQGTVVRDDVRNNERVMLGSRELAAELWETIEDYIPVEFEERRAVGLNELLRFYRYSPGQKFDWHQDFPYERDNGEASCYTLLIYLSDDFVGGETSFEDSYSTESFDPFSVKPALGMAVLFQHEVHHKGEPVEPDDKRQGFKYVLRTDVMYSPEEDESENVSRLEWEDDADENWDDSGSNYGDEERDHEPSPNEGWDEENDDWEDGDWE